MLEFPDVSNHNPGLNLAAAPACIAKATEGAWFTDKLYAGYRAQAVALAIPFAAYHWVDTDDLAAQAAHAHAVIGATPVMWDAEAPGSTVERLVELTRLYRALGGVASMVYLPRWWWRDHIGQADLRPLAAAGLALVSSDYDQVPPDGWAPYGGVTPTIWQFTSTHPYGGQLVDFNRYPGTPAQLAAVFAGTTPPPLEEDDMRMVYEAPPAEGGTGTGTIWLLDGAVDAAGRPHLWAPTWDAVQDYRRAGIPSTTALAPLNLAYYHRMPDGAAPVAGAVDLTPAAVEQVAQAVADEEAQRMAK